LTGIIDIAPASTTLPRLSTARTRTGALAGHQAQVQLTRRPREAATSFPFSGIKRPCSSAPFVSCTGTESLCVPKRSRNESEGKEINQRANSRRESDHNREWVCSSKRFITAMTGGILSSESASSARAALAVGSKDHPRRLSNRPESLLLPLQGVKNTWKQKNQIRSKRAFAFASWVSCPRRG
jgi:hypothetical protein